MEIFLFPVLTLFASLVGTASGLGFPLILVPAGAAFFPLTSSLLLTGALHFAESVRNQLFQKHPGRIKLVWGLAVPASAAGLAGAVAIGKLDNTAAVNLFGLYLLAYIICLGIQNKLRVCPTAPATLGLAAGSGLAAGCFGNGKVWEKLILKAYEFPKSVLVATGGFLALAIDLGRVTGYLILADSFPENTGWGFLLSLPAFYFGKKLAARYRNRISKVRLRPVVLILLALLGGYLLAI